MEDLIFMLVLNLLVILAQGQQIKFEKQPLPDNCETHIQDTSCPVAGWSYNEISEMCCGHIPGTVLHCQSAGSLLSIGCQKNTTVAKGTYIEIVNKDGLPVKVTHPCDDDSYEPDDRGSSSVTHPYCTNPKTKCQGEGQQLLCSGGPTRDNQCQCMPGWRSDCSRGFTGDDLCSCNRLPCPSGTERNITYQKDRELCPAETIPLKYTCITVKTAEVSTPANYTDTSSRSVPSPTPKTTANPSDDHTNENNLEFLALLLLIPVAVFVFTGLYKCNETFKQTVNNWTEVISNCTCKRNASQSPTLEPEPDMETFV